MYTIIIDETTSAPKQLEFLNIIHRVDKLATITSTHTKHL